MIGTSTRVLVEVGEQLAFRQRRPTDRPPVVHMDIPGYMQGSQELSLLVRLPSTAQAIDELLQATLELSSSFVMPSSASGVYHVAIVETEELERFETARRRCAMAAVTYEHAIRDELGVVGSKA